MVSVIVPNYNHAKFLDKRIQSVLNQTYQDFEIIILDDCSTDNSKEIIEKYRIEKKISAVIYNETNSGSTFKQWKKGIENAKGEYIWIAESDDYADKLFLEKTMALMDKYNTVVVFTDSVIIDENCNKLPDLTRKDLTIIKKEKCFDGDYFVSKYFTRGCTIYNASMTLFRKEKALKISGYENFRSCGDWYFWGNMILGSSVVFCNEKLNFLRLHNNNVTPKAARMGLQYLEGLDVSAYFMDRLKFNIMKRLWTGQYFFREIKKDKRISDETLRKQCIRKWSDTFPSKKIFFFIYHLLSIIELIQIKKGHFNDRFTERGLCRTITYYLNKCFCKNNISEAK